MRFRITAMFALLSAAALPAQYAYHFEFDQPGVLPNATPGVAVANLTSTPTTTFFATACGVLEQRTILDPTFGTFFYSGSVGGYPSTGPGMIAGLPSWAEARFTVLGGTGGAATVPDSTAVLGIFPGVALVLLLNCLTGDIGLQHASGAAWTTPPGGSGIPHTYRIEVVNVFSIPTGSLYIDGALTFRGLPLAATTSDGWLFGDAAGSNAVSTSIDWHYVSIGQTPPGLGQANSQQAALFVDRDNTTNVGQMGLKGPFAQTVLPGGTITLEWNGPPNQPFYLFAGGQFPALVNFGCTGLIDLSPPWTILFDPLAPFIGPIFFTNSCGYAKQTFLVPSSLPPGTPLMNIQGFVVQPSSSSCPFVITAAHYLST